MSVQTENERYLDARAEADAHPEDAERALFAARRAMEASLHTDAIVYFARALRANPAHKEARAQLLRIAEPVELESLKLPPPPPERSFAVEWLAGWGYPFRRLVLSHIVLGGVLFLIGPKIFYMLLPFTAPAIGLAVIAYGLVFAADVARAGASPEPDRIHWPGTEGDLVDAAFWTVLVTQVASWGLAMSGAVAIGYAYGSFALAVCDMAANVIAPWYAIPVRSWTDYIPDFSGALFYAAVVLPFFPVIFLGRHLAGDSLLGALDPIRHLRRYFMTLTSSFLVTFSFLVTLAIAAGAEFMQWWAPRHLGASAFAPAIVLAALLQVWAFLVAYHHIGLLWRHRQALLQ